LYGGPVAAAYVSNTDVVKKGQVLVLSRQMPMPK
jgi:multidrug resistance efflux pump